MYNEEPNVQETEVVETDEETITHGRNTAVVSLILGILSILFWFFGLTAIISIILGIIGLVLARSAKKAGYKGGMRTAGFALSLIGLIGGVLVVVFAILLMGAVAFMATDSGSTISEYSSSMSTSASSAASSASDISDI